MKIDVRIGQMKAYFSKVETSFLAFETFWGDMFDANRESFSSDDKKLIRNALIGYENELHNFSSRLEQFKKRL